MTIHDFLTDEELELEIIISDRSAEGGVFMVSGNERLVNFLLDNGNFDSELCWYWCNDNDDIENEIDEDMDDDEIDSIPYDRLIAEVKSKCGGEFENTYDINMRECE